MSLDDAVLVWSEVAESTSWTTRGCFSSGFARSAVTILYLNTSFSTTVFSEHISHLSQCQSFVITHQQLDHIVAAMHPCPSLQCNLHRDSRTFASLEDLMDHAKSARTLHPLCTTCQKVFKDKTSCTQVRFSVSCPSRTSDIIILHLCSIWKPNMSNIARNVIESTTLKALWSSTSVLLAYILTALAAVLV